MATADPTHNVRYAIRTLLSPRPTLESNRGLARFVVLALIALLVVILALSLFAAIHAPRELVVGVVLGWIGFVAVGSPIAVVLGARDQASARKRIKEWDSDPRRLIIEQLGMDLQAGRLTKGLSAGDVGALNEAATDWRHSREALEALTWSRGELAQLRLCLRTQLDDAMRNLLAEAGAGHPLGPSPFLMERARQLFAEVGAEANALAREQAPALELATDRSLEDLRKGLALLRDYRTIESSSEASDSQRLGVEG